MPKNNVTIIDIAQEAGVSAQTVSRVINNKKDVSSATRQRIQQIIERMGYHPNRVAQGLRASQSGALGVVTLNAQHPIPILAMEAQASALNYTLTFYSIRPDDPDDFTAKFNTIRAQMTDGVVVITPHYFITYEMILQHIQHIPVVIVNSHMREDTPSVMYDQPYGIRQAMQHLFDLGHRDICELGGYLETRVEAKLRHRAFVEMMSSIGITNPVSIGGDHSARGGYASADKLLNMGIPFTAVVCVNDSTALGAIQRLRHEGLRVPEDVSVIGFDDDMFAPYLNPPLTTVRQDFSLLGRTAISYLGELIENDDTPRRQRLLIPEFIIRESTVPPT